MKLIHSPTSPYARKCRVLILERGLQVEEQVDMPNDPASIVWKHNPLGRVPALILDDGSCVFDSPVICHYLNSLPSPTDAPSLVPTDPAALLASMRWEALTDGILDSALAARMEQLRREQTAEGAAWIARHLEKIERSLAFAQSELGGRRYCVGDSFSLADACLAASLDYLSFRFASVAWPSKVPGLAQWLAGVASRPSLQATVPG